MVRAIARENIVYVKRPREEQDVVTFLIRRWFSLCIRDVSVPCSPREARVLRHSASIRGFAFGVTRQETHKNNRVNKKIARC